ncbi:SRPBCC family protein [Jatrophihabitans telluris]|uniref:SRPBCC family protein n=1 Tax=Jatrophihabitans telluris TaxID=2038343 RepID=A0ABY4QTE3_9ACTN|nr:SRPBCC family protein [Jatrophihabitans telluris]UQX86638.1 SRPBCC family protein [Jatrophihabitans telluris]
MASESQPNESRYLVRVSAVIPAGRQQLFDVLADPAQHPAIDGGGSVKAVREGGPERLSLGATFAMDMHIGADYKILNTVVEFDEPSVIAWRHFNGHIWRYRFLEVDGGTQVVEEWDARGAKHRLSLLLLGFPARNRRGMTATLRRLADVVTARP